MRETKKKTASGGKRLSRWRVVSLIVLFSFLAGTFILGGLSLLFESSSRSGTQNKIPSTPLPSPEESNPAQDLKMWQETVRKDPNDPFALRNLAQALEAAGDNEKAREIAMRAQKLSPKDYLNQELLGQIDLQGKKYKEAVEEFRQATSLNPNDSNLQLELATALAASGQGNKAKELYRKIAANSPKSQAGFLASLSLLNVALQEKNYKEARAEAISLYDSDKENPEILVILGDIAEKQQKENEALSYYEKASKAAPGNSDMLDKVAMARYFLGLDAKKGGEKEKARGLLQQALKDALTAKDDKLKGKIQAAIRTL